MPNILQIMKNRDMEELKNLLEKVKKDVNYMHSDHREGRGSVISLKLKEYIMEALDEIHYKIAHELDIKYKG